MRRVNPEHSRDCRRETAIMGRGAAASLPDLNHPKLLLIQAAVLVPREQLHSVAEIVLFPVVSHGLERFGVPWFAIPVAVWLDACRERRRDSIGKL